MALINCSECGSEVSDKAASCPKCGNPISVTSPQSVASATDPREFSGLSKRSSRRLSTIAIVMVVVIVSLAIYRTRQPPPAESTSVESRTPDSSSGSLTTPTASLEESGGTAAPATTQPVAPPPVPVIEIPAKQLYAEYHANEVLADTKYKGNWLYVRGEISEIGKDFTDNPYVTLYGERDDNNFSVIRARFAKADVQQLSQLQKGQNISLMCRGRGMVIGDPQLDCSGNDTPPTPVHAPTTTAPAPSTADTPPAPIADQQPASTPTTYTTSFDCSKARSESEHLICNDAELAQDDVSLAATYTQAKAAATDQVAFVAFTRKSWNSRERNCHDRECLVRWFADEQAAFSKIAQTGVVE